MADNLSISVTADVASLTAKMAAATASVRQYRTELQAMVRDALASGGALDSSAILGKAGQLASATQGIQKLRSQMGELSKAGKEVGESMGESFRLGGGAVLRFRESLGSLREMAEAVGVAFVAEKVTNWAFEAAEAGEKTVNLAAAIGTTTERASELSVMMRLAGGEGDSLGRTMQILAQKTQEALQNPTSRTSDDFYKLGIGSAQLQDALKDPTTMVDHLAAAFQRLNEAGRSGEAIADLRAVLGRGGGEAIRLFRGGPEELEKLKAVAHETRAVIDTDLGEKMVETEEKVHTLGQAFEGLKNSIYKGLRDPLNEVLEESTKLLENLTGSRKLTGAEREKYWPQEWGPYDPNKRLLSGMWGGGDNQGAPMSDEQRGRAGNPYARYFAQSGNREGTGGAGPLADIAASTAAASARPAISQADKEIASMMTHAGQHLSSACAELVNEALKTAGYATSGSNLASSFKNYGAGVAAGDVRKGDVFYAGPSGDGDTGHVGVTMGPVKNGRVQVVSSHMQGDPSNPAGVNSRSAAGLSFRRPGASAGAPPASAGMTLTQADQAIRAKLAVARSDAEREMQDAQRKLMGGSGSQDAYKAATEKVKGAIAAQVAYENAGYDQQVAMAEKAMNGQNAAAIRAADETKQLDEEVAKSGEALATRRIEQAERTAAAQRKVDADWVKEYAAGIAAKVKAGGFTAQQGFGYDIQAVQAVQPGQLDRLRGISAMPGATPDQKSAIDDQISEISAAGRAQFAELQKQAEEAGEAAAEKFAAPFKSAFDRLGGTLTSGLAGLLEHKETARKFAMSLRDSMITSGVDTVGTGLSKAGGALLGGKQGQGIGDVLGDKIGNLVSQFVLQVSASSVNTAALAANTAAVSAAAAASGASGAASGIGGAASLFSKIPFIGSIFGSVPAAKGGWWNVSLPSYAGGGWSIPGGLSMLHQHEMVIPAREAHGLRNLIDGGGAGAAGAGAPGGHHIPVNVTNHFGHGSDAPGLDRMMGRYKNQIAGAVRRAIPT